MIKGPLGARFEYKLVYAMKNIYEIRIFITVVTSSVNFTVCNVVLEGSWRLNKELSCFGAIKFFKEE